MTEDEKWGHLVHLDEELLKGGVILSEWCSFIVREADLAFVKGAYLASILTATSGIETYLRSEYGNVEQVGLFQLINQAPIDSELKADLQKLRRYRNKWVHVNDPWDDVELLDKPDEFRKELEEMAFFAVNCIRRAICENPWI